MEVEVVLGGHVEAGPLVHGQRALAGPGQPQREGQAADGRLGHQLLREPGADPAAAVTVGDESLAVATELCGELGKTSVEAADYPGFIANRILMPMINEAIYAVMEGVGTPQAIDTVMKLGMNHPMGPLTLADFIGLDVCLAILEVMHQGMGDSKYRPCPLLRRMVSAGHLGRKTRKGFYVYDA